MKALAFLLAAALACVPVFAKGGGGSHGGAHSSSPHAHAGGVHNVKSHTTRSGTHVDGHRQTNPDGTKNNNWSAKGNVNPDTGKTGTKPGDK